MSTKIEWCEESWNPITGCTPVSDGCKNCYARRMANRLRGRFGYPKEDPFEITFHPDKLDQPLHWKKPRMIFVCSMGDLFHKDVEKAWIDLVFERMNIYAKQHTYLILTKRPENIPADKWQPYWKNIWLGVSVENQEAADQRIPTLLKIPAAKRFVSIEPILGPVDLRKWSCTSCKNGTEIPALLISHHYGGGCGVCMNKPKLDWVIVGGESGPGARPMHPDWVRSVRDQCIDAGIPFFFKQWGKWFPTIHHHFVLNDYKCKHLKVAGYPEVIIYDVGKKLAGRYLDGKIWDEYPE